MVACFNRVQDQARDFILEDEQKSMRKLVSSVEERDKLLLEKHDIEHRRQRQFMDGNEKWADRMLNPEIAYREIFELIPLYLTWYTTEYRPEENDRKVEDLTAPEVLNDYADALIKEIYNYIAGASRGLV